MTKLTNSEETSDGYKVGYGKPPKASQFKPGNTHGKGRQKGSKNLKSIVNEAIARKVSVQIDGVTQRVPKKEVLVHALVNKAVSGDLKAMGKTLELIERYEPITEDASVSGDEAVAYNLEALKHYLMMRGEMEGE
ncbi:DUF5681 domain-containing protein [Asticcacaulis tiandongensis]|uniref:DUF5681 domain-containing protein n=1 Tax=Asticcacaulis tiandongensis TaxID=2565365 RepID=UPI00112D5596|nr:DUF5681 domain-containing protein [Asticcacaulis tiandongensis]